MDRFTLLASICCIPVVLLADDLLCLMVEWFFDLDDDNALKDRGSLNVAVLVENENGMNTEVDDLSTQYPRL